MKLSSIVIGMEVGVPVDARTAEEAVMWQGIPAAEAKVKEHIALYGKTEVMGWCRAVVADVGVPYRKGRHGVVVELVWIGKEYQWCTCSQCGKHHIPDDAPEPETVEQRKTVTVHFSTLEPWADVLAEAMVREAQWELRREMLRKRMGE